jgi:hypothetical protein
MNAWFLVSCLWLGACVAPQGPASLQIVPAEYYSKQAPQVSVRAGQNHGPDRAVVPSEPAQSAPSRSAGPKLEEASDKLRELQRQLNRPERE